jgi:hypothetical protein
MSSLPDAKKRASDRRAKLLASAAEVDSYKPDDDEHNESHNEPEGAAEDDGGEQEREQPRALKHQRGKGRVASTGPPSKKYLRKRQVRQRYGDCTDRTIERKVKLGLLPAPEFPLGPNVPMWDEEVLDAHDQALKEQQAA